MKARFVMKANRVFDLGRTGDQFIGPAIFRPWSVPDSTRR
jgi:hypothetical protein